VATGADAGKARPPPAAGGAPCKSGGAKDARAAALACYASRVKPALLALAGTPKLQDYAFGDADYLRSVLGAPPQIATSTSWEGPSPTVNPPNVVVLGDETAVAAPRAFRVVTIALRRNGMPADGHTELVFFVDAKTFETVLVYRALLG